MGGTWKASTTENRVAQAIENLGAITIKDLTREKDFGKLSIREAYRVDGVHMYVELTNAAELLESSISEGETCHKKYIRFLNLYQRAVYEVLKHTNATKIDFQNHRLHTIIYKPYNTKDDDDSTERERERLVHALGVASLIAKLLAEANSKHPEIEDVEVAIGIETGVTLAVQNGTQGDREPLFLGPAANDAAKILKGKTEGIFLGERGRDILEHAKARCTSEELDSYEEEADLGISLDSLLKTWQANIAKLADIQFTRPTPPMKNFSFDGLTPKNSKRFEGLSVFADIDGFSKFVAERVESEEGAKEVVKVLHVLRKELRDVLNDFDGRKVRYHGDCIQGVMMEGTSKNTDDVKSIDEALKCVGAMRSAFKIASKELDVAEELGLAIGLAYGPVTLTALGIKGQRDRCALGRCVMVSEELQRECSGRQTQVNQALVDRAGDGAKALFEEGHRVNDLDYNLVCSTMTAVEGEKQDDASSGSGKALSAGFTPIIPKPFASQRVEGTSE